MIMWTALIGLMTVLLSISAWSPYYLSDDGNSFLRGFINHEFLSILGVIVTITLASAANIHLELNKLQDQVGKPFSRARAGICRSAYSLIIIFALGVVLVIVKPFTVSSQKLTAAANSAAIVIMFFSLSVLVDLTRTTFKIPAASAIRSDEDV